MRLTSRLHILPLFNAAVASLPLYAFRACIRSKCSWIIDNPQAFIVFLVPPSKLWDCVLKYAISAFFKTLAYSTFMSFSLFCSNCVTFAHTRTAITWLKTGLIWINLTFTSYYNILTFIPMLQDVMLQSFNNACAAWSSTRPIPKLTNSQLCASK